MVVLIIGKPGAGKTTYAARLAEELSGDGPVAILDSEAVRASTHNYDFSAEGRRTHLLYMAEMAAEMDRNGVETVIVAAVCPKREYRNRMRAKWEKSRLVYLPGGKLWEGTHFERPDEDEF